MRPRSAFWPVVISALLGISLVALRSISQVYAGNQLIFALVGISVFFLSSQIPISTWWALRWHIWVALTAFLLITIFIGPITNGSRSWLVLGSYRFQPSELLKPSLLLLLIPALKNLRLKDFLKPVLACFLSIFLVVAQPDFGTSIIVISGLGAAILARGLPKRWLLFGFIIFTLLAGLGWQWGLAPYQKDRIATFLDPSQDPRGSGYNSRQSWLAVASGGITGRGLGGGYQSQLRFLPERQTDFLFASFAEETGLVGSTLVVFLSATLIWFIVTTGEQQKDTAFHWLCLGMAAWIGMQMTINIGMNIGILPITGVPLPFFSLGGSSILATSWALGLVESGRRSGEVV